MRAKERQQTSDDDGPPGLIVDDSPSEVSSCDGWLPEDERVGPDHPDWDEATPLELIDPTTIDELKLSPSRPSSPNQWIIDKMFNND